MNDRFTTVNISTITILKVLLVILGLWFLFAIREIVLLFFICFIISSAIDPLADYLSKKKIPRGLSVLIVFVIFLSIIGLIISLMVPPIIDQFNSLAQSDVYENFVSKVGGFRDTLDSYGIGTTVTNSVKDFASSISQGLFNTTKSIFSGFLSVITVIVISFYLSAEENGTKNFIKHLVPYKNQAYVTKLVSKIQRKMGSWLIGQFILCFSIFALTYAGLLFLGVDYALVLALVAGLLEIIPYIGPIISVIPAILFAFIQSPPLVLVVLILYLIVQQLENHLLVPMVMSKSVGLNPILVILGVLVGSTLGGWVGAVIAVPLLSGIQVFIDDVMNSESLDQLEEKFEQ